MCALKSDSDLHGETNLKALELCLGISIIDRELLKAAITSNKTRENNPQLKLADFERLALLGDSILYFIASEYVYEKFEKENPTVNLHDEREDYRENYCNGRLHIPYIFL